MQKRVSTAGCGRGVAVGVALGWSHYPKLEGGLESGGFQSGQPTELNRSKHHGDYNNNIINHYSTGPNKRGGWYSEKREGSSQRVGVWQGAAMGHDCLGSIHGYLHRGPGSLSISVDNYAQHRAFCEISKFAFKISVTCTATRARRSSKLYYIDKELTTFGF